MQDLDPGTADPDAVTGLEIADRDLHFPGQLLRPRSDRDFPCRAPEFPRWEIPQDGHEPGGVVPMRVGQGHRVEIIIVQAPERR